MFYSDYLIRKTASGSPVFADRSGGVIGHTIGYIYDKDFTNEKIKTKLPDGKEIEIPIIITPNAFSVIRPSEYIIRFLHMNNINYYYISKDGKVIKSNTKRN